MSTAGLSCGQREMHHILRVLEVHGSCVQSLTITSAAAFAWEALPDQALQDVQQSAKRLCDRASRIWKTYEGELESHPVRTKALTSMVGLAVGDLIAQASSGCFDPDRLARMTFFGLVLHGPVGHYWFELLDKHMLPGTSTKAIVGKMMLDQAVFSPIFTAVFYAVLTLLEGHPASIPQVLSDRLLTTIISGYALWPLAHLVSFKFVPNEYRLLYINVVNLVWTVHLSKLASAPIALDNPIMAPPESSSSYAAPFPTIPVSNPVDGGSFVTAGSTSVHTI